MAMNKTEQAAFADLQEQLRRAKAMRFTDPVERDVPIPDSFASKLSKGWDFNAYINSSPRVERACSSSIGHSFGRDDQTSSQNPRKLYSSKLLALRAMRHAVEEQCAVILANIDRQIEEAKDT